MSIFEYILIYLVTVAALSLIFKRWLLPIWLERFENENKKAEKSVILPPGVLRSLVFWLNTLFLPIILIETLIYLIRKRRQ